jgi:sodium/hydrogen exchanger 8
MWLSGLRGAVAFALAVTFLENPHFGSEIKSSIFSTTIMVILFTVLGFGGMTPLFIKWLKIIPDVSDNLKNNNTSLHSLHHIDHDVTSPSQGPDQTITADDLNQPIIGWLYRFDVKYFLTY